METNITEVYTREQGVPCTRDEYCQAIKGCPRERIIENPLGMIFQVYNEEELVAEAWYLKFPRYDDKVQVFYRRF